MPWPTASDKVNTWEGLKMSMLSEFRDFALKGNVVDLAVGVIIGAAFGKIVESLVDNVLMPPIGLRSAAHQTFKGLGAGSADQYGVFLQTVVDFADHRLLLVPGDQGHEHGEEALREASRRRAPAEPPPQSEVYLKEIRDALVTER